MSEQPNTAKAPESAQKSTDVPNKVEIVDASQFGKDVQAATDKGLSFTESDAPKEIGGREGPEPTRFGDWEKNGRCIDF